MLEIVEAGHEALRTPGTDVDPGAPWIDELVVEMTETLRAAPGVGLAAHQIGRPIRLAVVEDRAEYQEGVDAALLTAQGRGPVALEVVVNPTLEAVGDETAEWFEGCLSVPGYAAIVPRWSTVRLRAQRPGGEAVDREVTGWHARILQHEVDHLNGRLYVDRMLSRTFMTTEAYLAEWRSRPIAECRGALGVA